MMSIFAATVPATAPTEAEQLLGSAVILGPALLIAVTIAWLASVFRRGSIVGPTRLPPDEPVVAPLLITIAGGAMWLLSQIAYGFVLGFEWQENHPGETFDITELSADEIAFLATVPAAIGLAVLVIGDLAVRKKLPQRLGYALRRIGPGIGLGIVATLIVLPVIWTFSVLVEWIYKRAGIQHPDSHELLQVMREAPDHVQWLLILGACVAAPVFEEFLFRGHIQTVLLRLFIGRSRPMFVVQPMAKVFPYASASPANDLPPPPLAGFAPPPLPQYVEEAPNANRRRLMTWMAVIVTSVMFTAVHELWMAPLIFLLSMGLGFAYERTGNLWVAIVIHALFNTSSTLVYLHLA